MVIKNPFYRKPDFVVGHPDRPYMLRWFVIPRNKYFNIYLHKFINDDYDRALHDHPWGSLAILLRGKYIEHLSGGRIKIRKRGAFIYRTAEHRHRIELFRDRRISEHTGQYVKTPRRVWTLFMTGPKVREWGFWCPKGFVHWKDFVDPTNEGQVGKGCD